MKTKKSLLTPLPAKEEKEELEPTCQYHIDFQYYSPDKQWLFTKCLKCNIFLRKKKVEENEK